MARIVISGVGQVCRRSGMVWGGNGWMNQDNRQMLA